MEYCFDDVDIVFGETNFDTRKAIRMAMLNSGMKRVEDVSRTDKIRAILRARAPDLIICDVDLPEGDFCHICHEMRNQKLGHDPFVPVIALAFEIRSDNVAMISAAGVDHILTKPVSLADLMSRVRAIIERRKPFVVTQDYVGPDRRNEARDSGPGADLIDVPNVIKAKVENNKAEARELIRKRQTALLDINTQRVQKQAQAIVAKVDIVLPLLEIRRTEETTDILNSLLEMIADVRRRLGSTNFGHTLSLCGSLADTLFRIQKSETANRKDVMILKPLSQAIVASFLQQSESVVAAKKIISMVDSSIRLD